MEIGINQQTKKQSKLVLTSLHIAFRFLSDSLSDFLFFLFAVIDSCPLSSSSELVFVLSESELELLELLELSEARPKKNSVMTCCENQMYTNLMVVLDWFFLPMLLAQADVLAVLSTIFLIILVFLLQFYAIPVQLLYIFNNQFCYQILNLLQGNQFCCKNFV